MLETPSREKRILIIDRQESWREFSARVLREAGFSVSTLPTYDYPPPGAGSDYEAPDLVILGCPRIGEDEHKLIARVLEHKDHLLVLCTMLPWHAMRSVFLAGADDVADKPFDALRLVSTVEEAFENMAPRDNFRTANVEG